MSNTSRLIAAVAGISYVAVIAWGQPQYTISRLAGGVGIKTGVAATSTYWPIASGVAWDSTGGFYVSANNQVFHINQSGIVDSIIGNGAAGFAGDGGFATAAAVELYGPTSLAVDVSGNLYINDFVNARIRRVDKTTQKISTVAGNGESATKAPADGSQATSVAFGSLFGMAVDSSGNLYLTDFLTSRVYEVTLNTGVIATVAGSDQQLTLGDGGPATSAFISGPQAVAIDSAGNLYIGGGDRIRKVTTSTGIITTIAGNGVSEESGDGGPATSAEVSGPRSLGFDSAGNLFLSDHFAIRKIDPSGTITAVANGGTFGFYSGDGKPVSQATVPGGQILAVDGSGDLLYTDLFDLLVLRIDGVTSVVKAVAGSMNSIGDGGLAVNAQLSVPAGLAVDSIGNVYIADSGAPRVRKISAATGIISSVAGNGTRTSTGDGGLAINAGIGAEWYGNPLMAIAFDPSDNLYTFDTNKIRMVSAQTGIITTVAGGGTIAGTAADGGQATSADLSWVTDIVADGSSLYLPYNGDVRRNSLRQVDLATGVISTLLNGTFYGLDRDDSGNLYLSTGGSIEELPPGANTSGGTLIVNSNPCKFPATCPITSHFTDAQLGDGGPAQAAVLSLANGVKVDKSGNLYIADAGDFRIRFVSKATGNISTIAGTNAPGCSGNQGPATDALFTNPGFIALDSVGNVYVADSSCGAVYKLTPVRAYAGSLDTATCQAVSGWAADQNRLNQSINVSIYDGSTLIATVPANLARSDVGSYLGDNGLHGFSYTLPAALTGGAHSIHVEFESSSTEVGGSPKALTCGVSANPSYAGSIDSATCSGISGWVADRNRLNTSITVSLWDGATQIASTTANASRPDVGAVIGDNGLHGFSLQVPSGYKNGAAHTLQVHYESTGTQVGSPFSLTCGSAGTNYAGNIDSASCTGISGWVADRNRPNTSITVSLWDGATQIASTTANASRSDVGAYLSDNGLHGFSLQLPAAYKNGAAHTLQVHYESTATEVGSPITLTCGSTVNYAGNIDSATCAGISGWVADRNRPNTPITVSLWDGATQIASTTANASRSDVGAYLSDNGLHGFSLQVPSAYKNGAAHTLQVHYESTASEVGQPFTLTCGSTNYLGFVDSASCSGISGWAADLNRLNTSITVSLWDGATQIASTTANSSRPDVGAAIGDNGVHGYSLQLPSAYANGVSHALQVHFESSSTQLIGSPVTLKCGSATANYAGNVDILNCTTIAGWAADRNNLNTSVNVSIYNGSTLLTTILAATSRPDVGMAIGDNGLHGFSIPTPASLKDGATHTITMLPGNSQTPLAGSQSLSCQ